MTVVLTEEASLAFLHRLKSAVSTIAMAEGEHFLGSTTDTENLAQMFCELKDRHNISALLTYYHLVSIMMDESVTQYVDRVRSL